MPFTKTNVFHYKEWLPLKGIFSTDKRDFHWMEWLQLQTMFSQHEMLLSKGMASTNTISFD